MSGLKMKYHYVYRITNKIKNKHYYGVRSSYLLPKEDLGHYYFSSSTDSEFINEQHEHPENFKYKIVKVFNNRKEAELYEKFIHEKFHVSDNEHFYNKAISTLLGFSVEGTKQSEEHIRKRVQSRKEHYQYKRTFEEIYGVENAKKRKQKLSDVHKGNTYSVGRKLSESHKKKISEALYKRYENKEFLENFKITMQKVTSSEEYKENMKMILHKRWEDPKFRIKMKNRKHKTCKIIKVTKPDKTSFIYYKGFDKLCKEFNFSEIMVRTMLKTNKIYISNYTSEKTKNTNGYMFEEIKNEN